MSIPGTLDNETLFSLPVLSKLNLCRDGNRKSGPVGQNPALADFELSEEAEMITLIDRIHYRASFVDKNTLKITKVDSSTVDVGVGKIVLAVGFYPGKQH